MRAFFIVVVFAIFATTGSAPADTIYSNFGSGQTYDTADPMSTYNLSDFTPLAYAVSFTSNGNYTLDSISVAFKVYSSRTQSVDAMLYCDGGGKPGAVLENLGSQVVPGVSSAIYTFSSANGSKLDSGVRYWLAVLPDAGKQVYWFKSLTDARGYAESVNNGTSWTSASTTGITPVFSVSGTPVSVAATAAPLPSAAWAGAALFPLAMIAGLRRRQQIA